MSEPAAPLRDVAIIGGGCYGTFYARQLATARRKNRLSVRRILVVDRDPDCQATRELEASSELGIVAADWDAFLREFLDSAPPAPGAPDDAVVPSPLMPHLMANWLLGAARALWPGREVELAVPDEPLRTPYDALGPDGNRYVSFADWICPVHCIEPLTCPMIRAPRTWEMGEALARYTERLDTRRPTAGPALFTTRHHSFGVGMFGAAEIRASRMLLEAAGNRNGPVDVVVGTVSACHGAISILRLGARNSLAIPDYISCP
jgi:hypothetical protein